MTVEEGVCKDRSKWNEVISALPKINGRDVMYVSITRNININHNRYLINKR
jgi:hypothetical protein